MARILLVEDEPELARALSRGLCDAAHTVDVVMDGEAAMLAAASERHELMILDLLLPGIPGLDLCRRLRARGWATPILMLTALGATEDVVQGLDAGANDYLVKPFEFDELLARIRALLRHGSPARSALMTAGELELDSSTHSARLAGRSLPLTQKEYQLLEVLLRHKGTVVSRRRLVDSLWQGDLDPESNSLEVHVARLRRKIGTHGGAPLLHTVRGFGYVVREPGPAR